jgi:orotate phosphoribosyltransferase
MPIARDVASALNRIQAVHFYRDEPFRFTSGVQSPVYVDCRKPISFPAERRLIIDAALQRVNRLRESFDVIAGGETAGIPYAAWLAEELGKPMIYVRKNPKSFGTQSQIEGVLNPGSHVLLVEDLIFDAGTKLRFAQVVRNCGAQISHTLVVFNYGYKLALQKLREANLSLHSLCSWVELLEELKASDAVSDDRVEQIRDFLSDPQGWAPIQRNAQSA